MVISSSMFKNILSASNLNLRSLLWVLVPHSLLTLVLL